MKLLKLSLPPLVAVAAFLYFALPLQVLAANGTLYLTPHEGRFTPGSTFSVEIRANTGGANRQVTRATLNYPNNLLEATESNSYGSAFSSSSTSVNHGAGRVTFTAYDSTPPTGSNLFVYRVNFKVIGQGDAKVTFANDVAVNGTLANKQEANYGLYPANCPVGQVGTPPQCSIAPVQQNPVPSNPGTKPSPARPSTPTPNTSNNSGTRPSTSLPNSPLPPIPTPTVPETSEPIIAVEPVETPPSTQEEVFGIGNIRTKTLYDTSTVQWESSHAATGTFSYGSTSETLDKRVEVTQETPTTFSATIPSLKPGEKYFYEISATQTDNTTKSDSHKSSLSTKGYPVKVTAIYNETPLFEAALSLKNFSGNTITDKQGASSLELKEGTYEVSVKKDDISINETITIKALDFAPGGIPDTQNFNLTGTGSTLGGGSSTLVGVIVGVVILLLAGGAVTLIIIRKKRAATAAAGYQSVIVEDWTPPSNTTYVNPATGEFNVPPPPSYPQAPRDDAIPENEYFADLDRR